MKKRILSIALVLCMALSLLPVSALAATNYDGWEAATAEGVTLAADTDTVTIDGVSYTYKDDASASGIKMYSEINSGGNVVSRTALTEACCWKAGDGYVLYQPTVVSGETTSAEVTLHNAEISTTDIDALSLPYNSSFADRYAVPVTVNVEGTNSLTTTGAFNSAVYHSAGDTTFTGGGTLTITGQFNNHDAVTIESGTTVVVNGGTNSQIAGNLTVTGSGSKLTIASGTTLAIGVWGGNPAATVTVENGGVLENNGTLTMAERVDPDNSHIVGEISGSGGIMLYDKTYALVGGVFYAYGGDVEKSGLNLSGKDASGNVDATYNAPTIQTCYRAGSGYIIYTPATADPAANAKLELHDATISTTSGRALYLPGEALDITVTGNNSLTANGSYNYAIDTNEQAVNITGGGNLSLTGNRGIAPWSGNTPSITIDIGGALNIKTTSNPIQNVTGDLKITAKSITIGDAYGVFCDGMASFEATDGDITLTGGSFMGAVNGNAGVSLKASGKITVDNSTGSSALISQSGTVTVDAQGDVAMEANGVAIHFGTGVSTTSDAGSIDVTTGGYSGIEKTDGGTGGGGVTLSAAKDITLNADASAISASEEAVNLTAGGTLSSTSKYGFQVRELTIKANEVSIEGTQQDGILATSVSITNPTGGNCKSVSVTGSGGDSYAAIRALGSADTGNITVKADDLFLCGNDSAKAISTLGTVTIEGAGLIVGEISAGTDNIAAGIARASVSGGDKSGGLNLSTPPTETTVYTADKGYVLFTPATTTPAAPAKLTLHNATIHNTTAINDATGDGIALPDGAITLVVEGTNTISAQYTNAIGGSDTDVTLSGSGVLNVGYRGITLKSTAANPHSFTKGANVTLNGIVNTYDNSSENSDSNTNTVYGSVSVPADSHCTLAGTITVAGGAVLTIPQGTTLDLHAAKALTNNGTLVNNGTLQLPQSYNTEAAVKALKLTGDGLVQAVAAYDTSGNVTMWSYYTNDGTAVKAITNGLDLTGSVHNGSTVADNGYEWDSASSTLTLGNIYVEGGITLPTAAPVTINSGSSSSISGTIGGDGHAPLQLTFSGTAPLSINGGINSGINGDTVTVQSGAQVTLNGHISIGASGTDGTLTVTGAGTVLNINSDMVYGAMCDTVNVQNGAALTVHTQGAGTRGVEALSGGVSVTGGSTLTVGCDYGVYIIGGKLTVDSTSKLITNGAVAPFCIVGAANSTQNDVLSLTVDLPSGTEIASRQATNGSGTTHTYWSLVPTNGNLTVSDTDNTPVTLAGAVTGTLTFAKAASNPTGGGSGSTSYTLTFETNGGSKISSVSKASGTAIDLGEYQPTRDGYTFDGWYSDKELTEKVTSVELTKNMTVYAKWTEKITNPFADVSDSDYYHDAVLWAVKKGVTGGTSNTAFSPDMTCTRAQMAVFLWRAEGSPEPASTNCPFTDVSKDAYYYKAVLWAVEKGITAGTSTTTFGSDDIVTRGQAVTFLWRAAGKPEAASVNPFTDVSKDVYFYDAVLWAVEKGVTAGTSATTFSPSGPCNRAQIVTFLYRYMGNSK
ncbi:MULTISPECIES: S-layer homology domain-containing protein [unclassified Oscillibacter]|uniref:S-layer homology domain-containing protein n=1 Tax=unclassified Oscillibacter TaxID=2629304 RepID=UPI0025E82977|nr:MULTISPECIES: S-layer homology domain-containing protein [unclassified Oscillibacter]